MKRIGCIVLTVILMGLMLLTVSANRTLPLLVDQADLLTTREERLLQAYLEQLSEEMSCEIAVLTVTSLGGKSAQAYADDFYDDNGYGYGPGDDGLLLLVAIQERSWAITTYGTAHRALGNRDLDRIEDAMLSDLSAGSYYDAFVAFADAAREGVLGEAFDWKETLVIAVIVGFVLALITVTVMKGNLKSVRPKNEAAAYVIPKSLDLHISHDRFLYRNVRRVRIDSSSSGGGTHRSSSGRSHGGRSGRF